MFPLKEPKGSQFFPPKGGGSPNLPRWGRVDLPDREAEQRGAGCLRAGGREAPKRRRVVVKGHLQCPARAVPKSFLTKRCVILEACAMPSVIRRTEFQLSTLGQLTFFVTLTRERSHQ